MTLKGLGERITRTWVIRFGLDDYKGKKYLHGISQHNTEKHLQSEKIHSEAEQRNDISCSLFFAKKFRLTGEIKRH